MKNNFICILTVVIVLFLQINIYGDNKNDITFGIVPQQSAQKLAQKWTPILKYLSKKTGYNIIFSTAPNIPEFEKRIARGDYDIAYMNPYHYCVFNRSAGYKAFARQINKQIKGIIVVRKDSIIKDLSEFKGKTLAFPSSAAFAASILTRANLRKLNIEFEPKYVKSHDSVYRTVAKNLYAGGGGVLRTFMNMDPAITKKLRILWTSSSYTPHAFAAHPSVPDKIVSELLKALTGMNGDPSAKKLLDGINFNGFESAKNSDWDDVRDLNIEELDHFLDE